MPPPPETKPRLEAGEQGSGARFALEEGVDGVAPGGHGRAHDRPVLCRSPRRGSSTGGGAAAHRLLEAGAGVVDGEGDVAHAVAVAGHVAGDLVVGLEGGGEDEADVPLAQQVAGLAPRAGLRTAVGDLVEAEEQAVVGRGLAGVAHPELDVIDLPDRERGDSAAW